MGQEVSYKFSHADIMATIERICILVNCNTYDSSIPSSRCHIFKLFLLKAANTGPFTEQTPTLC